MRKAPETYNCFLNEILECVLKVSTAFEDSGTAVPVNALDQGLELHNLLST